MQIDEVVTAPHSPFQNDYASHYTSSVLSALNAITRSINRSFWHCAFTGGFVPGSSYKRAVLSSYRRALRIPCLRQISTVETETPSLVAISFLVSRPASRNLS